MPTSKRKNRSVPIQSRLNDDDEEEVEKRLPDVTDHKSSKANSGVYQSRTVFIVTYFNVFLYATCFFIQTGTLPYLSKKLGADPTIFGQLQTVFAVAQLLGGPLYGRLGDVAGERLALIVSFVSAASSYFLAGIAGDLTVLFVSRLPSALMHTMQGSQMIITNFSNDQDRASSLSRLAFFYGTGMVVGPALGGYVVKFFGEQTASLFASLGMCVSLVLVYFFIPDMRKVEKKNESIFNLKKMIKPCFASKSSMLLIIKFICGVPIGIIQSMFSVVAMERFGLPAEQNGLMLSYIGAISLFMQGMGIQALSSRLSDKILMQFSAVTLMIAYYAFTLVNEMFDFFVLLFPLTCSLCLVNSILTSSLTKTVSKGETGTILGLNMAVHSSIRSFSPVLGGYLMTHYGYESFGFIGVAANAVTLALLSRADFKEEV